MAAQVFGRASSGLLVLWLVSMMGFMLLALTPGDPARLILSASSADIPTPEVVAAKRAELGLDAPLYVRYTTWAGAALRGDFGISYRTGEPVWDMYLKRLPATLMLAGLSLTIVLCVAVPLGIAAAYHRGGRLDMLLQVIAVIGAAAPGFWLALLLILVFAATLRWLPALGTPTLAGMVLPAVVLALPSIAVLARLLRASMLDALTQPYMTTALAKGRLRHDAMIVHALPNVLVTQIPVVALNVAHLLTGTVVIETVFAFPGVGRLAVDAALVGDMPVLVLCIVMAALCYIMCNWLADVGMAASDPRIRTL